MYVMCPASSLKKLNVLIAAVEPGFPWSRVSMVSSWPIVDICQFYQIFTVTHNLRRKIRKDSRRCCFCCYHLCCCCFWLWYFLCYFVPVVFLKGQKGEEWPGKWNESFLSLYNYSARLFVFHSSRSWPDHHSAANANWRNAVNSRQLWTSHDNCLNPSNSKHIRLRWCWLSTRWQPRSRSYLVHRRQKVNADNTRCCSIQ